MNRKNQHVVPHDKGWAVKSEGSTKAASVHTTQSAAIQQAKETAERVRGEVLIHGENGQIRERNSYGNDPYPPKG